MYWCVVQLDKGGQTWRHSGHIIRLMIGTLCVMIIHNYIQYTGVLPGTFTSCCLACQCGHTFSSMSGRATLWGPALRPSSQSVSLSLSNVSSILLFDLCFSPCSNSHEIVYTHFHYSYLHFSTGVTDSQNSEEATHFADVCLPLVLPLSMSCSFT